jgi:hypothetical protein
VIIQFPSHHNDESKGEYLMKPKYTATFLVLFMFSPLASAACNTQSASGIWGLYINSSDGVQAVWQRCTVSLNNRGEFLNSSTCISNTGAESAITNGSLEIARTCSFTGQFDIGTDTYVVDGRLSRNKFNMAGVGTIGDSTTELFSFDAVRQ